MSAYLVNKDHIDLLCSAAEWVDSFHLYTRNEPRTLEMWDATDPARFDNGRTLRLHAGNNADVLQLIGLELIAANVASLKARYDDAETMLDDYVTNYQYSRIDRDLCSIETALAAISGYEYQACETETWTQSFAYDYCNALRRQLCNKIANMSDGWNYERPANMREIVSLMDIVHSSHTTI